MTRLVVGICGPAGSGKTTAADRLVDRYGFARVKLAGPLKAMLRALPGIDERHTDGDLKEEPVEAFGGATPRYMMQTLGTGWGRGVLGEDFWVRVWEAAVAEVPSNVSVVVDDVRFDNEARAVLKLGGRVVEMKRGGYVYRQDHASEVGVAQALITDRLAPKHGVAHVHATVDHWIALLPWPGGGAS